MARGSQVVLGGKVSPMAKDAVRKIALRVAKDPAAATLDDVRKLSRAVLLLVDGRLPQ